MKELTPTAMTAEMNKSWGQRRNDWVEGMGPIDAWRYGSNWETKCAEEEAKEAVNHPEMALAIAKRLFDDIRAANYDTTINGCDPDFISAWYCAQKWCDVWIMWICANFKKNPLVSVEFGAVTTAGKNIAIPYKAVQKDGFILQGTLQLQYLSRERDWMATGLDWHLEHPERLPEDLRKELGI